MYSYGPSHMPGQKQDDQSEHTYSSYVKIWDVALKTCQRRWMIGRSGERGSEISVPAAQHDDDDIYIYIFTRFIIRKLERVLNKLYRQNLSLLFNETCLNKRLLPNRTHTHTHTHTHTYTHICIYLCVRVCVCVCMCGIYIEKRNKKR